MTEQELKNKLLSTSLFIDNEYLQQYIKLVLNYSTKEAYTEKHHILQRKYYKLNNLPVDNSTDNIVNLAYKDHCKAHWLLYFCTVDQLKQANEASVRYISEMYKKLTGVEKHKFDFIQEDFDLLQQYMNDIINDKDSRYWSDAEVQFLKENYSGYGAGLYCAKKLNKSLARVNSKARLLNLGASCPNWSEAEISILTKYYPIEGDKVYLRISAHSRAACRAKAVQLGIKTTTHYWTSEEIDILIQNFPILGSTGCSKLLSGRNRNECKHKAERLGLVFVNNPQKIWTEEKLNLLYANLDKSIIELKQILNFSYTAIKNQLIKLNLYNKSVHCMRQIKETNDGKNNDRR